MVIAALTIFLSACSRMLEDGPRAVEPYPFIDTRDNDENEQLLPLMYTEIDTYPTAGATEVVPISWLQ